MRLAVLKKHPEPGGLPLLCLRVVERQIVTVGNTGMRKDQLLSLHYAFLFLGCGYGTCHDYCQLLRDISFSCSSLLEYRSLLGRPEQQMKAFSGFFILFGLCESG